MGQIQHHEDLHEAAEPVDHGAGQRDFTAVGDSRQTCRTPACCFPAPSDAFVALFCAMRLTVRTERCPQQWQH
ncbi:hypothetical protein SRIMM317S_01613 [Streptomyces rimosus subsp. rimosus]